MASPLPLLLLLLPFSINIASADTKVPVSIYYESLCPYCSGYIVDNLAKIFQNGLISIVDLHLVPYGNAHLTSDDSIICQHGPDECLLNAIEACAIRVWPDSQQHFPFISCIEYLILAQRGNQWQSCFQETGLSTEPVIDCYNNGLGNQLELQYGAETDALQPPHQFVPWVVVDGKPLRENFMYFEAYICKAFDGEPPEACRGSHLTISQEMRANQGEKVCMASENVD